MGGAVWSCCGGAVPRGRCRACGLRDPWASRRADRFDELDLGDDIELGGPGAPALELDREAARPAAAGPRLTARDRDLRDAAAVSGFGDAPTGRLGAFLYAVNALWRRRSLARETVEARRAHADAARDAIGALGQLARVLVGDAHRREMAHVAEKVGALYATAQRTAGTGRLPQEAVAEVLRLREAVRSRLRRAVHSVAPGGSSWEDDGRLSFPADLLPTEADRAEHGWLESDDVAPPSGPVSEDAVQDFARALADFAGAARRTELGEAGAAAERARQAVLAVAAAERKAALLALAPDTLDRATFERGWTYLASALGLVGAMIFVITVFALLGRL